MTLAHTFSTEQVAALAQRGIDPETAQLAGVTSVQTVADLPEDAPTYWDVTRGYLPGLLFRWSSPVTGAAVLQLRPDTPVAVKSPTTGEVIDVKKYVFPKDSPSILHAAKTVEEPTALLITEGTCQTIATAAYAPEGISVYGIAGCQSWMKNGVPTRDLEVVEDHEVFVALDADAATNLNVYEAGVALREALLAAGAKVVRFIRVPGGAKSGLDDVLGQQSEGKRTAYLGRLIESARNRPKTEKPELPAPVKPKAKKDDGNANPFFREGSLQVATLSAAAIGMRPAALTRENKIALFTKGVYRIDGSGFTSAVAELLGEDYRIGHETNTEKFTIGQLYAAGKYLPDRMSEPLLNCANLMVNLKTGEVVEHDSKFLSTTQIPVDFDPAAKCPTYDQWSREQIGSQIDDLEESVAFMLDPTITPTKAVFLFGPSRSGKSTMLRIMQALAGPENTSGVSLHQLSDDRFAAANLYGKMLNISADLSAAHVEDISIFKMLTGEDLIQANRKYGNQFAFTNRALFAFSANELPTVGESSRAYSERIKPFHFPNSFAGKENPALELTMLRDELPGILNRLIAAYRRRVERGAALETDPIVREKFEMASDRVRQFVNECCEIVPVETGQGGSTGGRETTISALYNAFKDWAAEEGKSTMAKSKFRLRLSGVPGVLENVSSGKSRGWNIKIKPRGEWSDSGTLSVSDLPSPDVDPSSSEGDSVMTDVPRSGKGESERTKFHDSADGLDDLRALVPAAPAPDPCPDCDGPRTPRPHSDGLLLLCAACNPASFTWEP